MSRIIDIFGSPYTIETRVTKDDPMLAGHSGYCDESTKMIVLADFADRAVYSYETEEEQNHVYKKTLRHEILHAVLNECGLQECSDWARNEEMVDFFAIMYPKLKQMFRELRIED